MSSAPQPLSKGDHRGAARSRGGFKQTLDGAEARRSRQETTVQIRKAKQADRLAKRRQQTPMGTGGRILLEQNNSGGAAVPGGSTSNGADGAVAFGGVKAIRDWAHGLYSNDAAIQTETAKQFRKLLSIEKDPPIQQVIDAGVVPRLLELLQRDDCPELQ